MVIALANQKGGVGKTTVTAMLASALSRTGLSTLVVDADPQASATRVVGVDPSERISMADVMLEPGSYVLSDAITTTAWGFDLVPSEIALARKDRIRDTGDEHVLRKQLEALAAYDMVLVDAPPSLGIMTLNSLTAADRLLIVTEPGYLALSGMGDLLETVETVNEHLRAVDVGGVIVNMVDGTQETARRVEEIRSYFGQDLVLDPTIPRRTVIREAIGHGLPLHELGRQKGAADIAELFERLAERALANVPA
jgi:chromosome partitioning protein